MREETGSEGLNRRERGRVSEQQITKQIERERDREGGG